jgi:hypothetical protein
MCGLCWINNFPIRSKSIFEGACATMISIFYGAHRKLRTIAILRIMSFLDNLENNLKALESRTERDPEALAREAAAREAARSAALEIAPHAEALRNGPFKDGLLTACREIGHRRRILVRPVWVDSTLRLEAGAKKLELRPTPNGVIAVFFDGGKEQESTLIDLSSDPAKVAERWLEPNGT